MAELTEWDRRIIAGMEDAISRYEKAIAGRAEHELVRPLIGDAPMKSVTSWRADIAQNRRWIAEIERQEHE